MSSGEDAPSPDLFEAEMEPLETAVATAPSSSLDNVPGKPEHSGPNAGEKVPGGAAAARREMQDARKLELQHIWNAECGPYLARLRYPDKIIKEHRKPLQDFMADVKGEDWADVVRDWTYACRSVAAEPWWVDAEKRYGFKTLLAKWRSKAQQWEAQPLGIDADPEDVLRHRRAQEAEGRGQGRGEAKLEVSGPEGDWRGRKW